MYFSRISEYLFINHLKYIKKNFYIILIKLMTYSKIIEKMTNQQIHFSNNSINIGELPKITL